MTSLLALVTPATAQVQRRAGEYSWTSSRVEKGSYSTIT